MNNGDLLNIVQAAAYLGLSKQRIHHLAKNGRIGKKIAGHFVFCRAELDAYDQQRSEKPKGGRPRSSASN